MTIDCMYLVMAAIRHVDDGIRGIQAVDSLVLHLGFDSLKMTLLGLALETEFGRAIALDGWISSHPDPNELTVGSLCTFLSETLDLENRTAISA